MEKTSRKVVHLHLLKDDLHEYYGSLSNIYDYHKAEEIGITYGSLKNISKSMMDEGKPYVNKECIIRIGVLRQKETNRGRKA